MEHDAVGSNEEEKLRTIFIGNIPGSTSKRDIECIFGEIGPLKRCHIQYPKNFKRSSDDTTVAYVTFAKADDAVSAVEKLNNLKVGGNKLLLKLTRSSHGSELSTDNQLMIRPKFGIAHAEPSRAKAPRKKIVNKKPRLIIRNLSFKVTEENLREYFQPFGSIKEINIIKKSDGKLVGCAFLQYETVYEALNAMKALNLKPFLNRPIAIDWALPKKKYQGEEDVTVQDNDVKPELDVKVKDEPVDLDYEKDNEVKPLIKEKQLNNLINDEEKVQIKNLKEEIDPSKRVINPNDADEGRTLFVRNLNFDTTSESLKEFFQEFGSVNYAVVCMDPLTEHSKGTGFVKFRFAEELQKCLEKYEERPETFFLDDRQIHLSQALSKSKLTESISSKASKQPKDKRNLYLVREGFIRLGTTAAEGMSQADLNLRAALHTHKKQMLKDLKNFISDRRLCIHNLPENYTDNKLRSLMQKHGGAGAKVVEARILRDTSQVTPNGFKSKGFGFVTFTEHENALTALRALNNNPEIFSKHQRPIVEFSLEKKSALKTKEKREENSRISRKTDEEETHESTKTISKKRKIKTENMPVSTPEKVMVEEDDTVESVQTPKKTKKSDVKQNNDSESEELPNYSGLASKQGLSTIPNFKAKGFQQTKRLIKASKPKQRKLKPRRKRERRLKSSKANNEQDKFEKTLEMYKKANFYQASSISNKKSKWYS